MIEYETVTKTKELEVPVAIFCDVCEKKFKDGYYYRVMTMHHDWGRDSVDSMEWKHICSDKCLKKEFQNYLEKEKSNSKEIQIEKSYFKQERIESDFR